MAPYQIDTVFVVTIADLSGAADCVLVRANNEENAKYKAHDLMPKGWTVEHCAIATAKEKTVWDAILDYDFS